MWQVTSRSCEMGVPLTVRSFTFYLLVFTFYLMTFKEKRYKSMSWCELTVTDEAGGDVLHHRDALLSVRHRSICGAKTTTRGVRRWQELGFQPL